MRNESKLIIVKWRESAKTSLGFYQVLDPRR